MKFSARSYIEEFQECPRSRYNMQFMLGNGVVRIGKSVPLVTGSAVHSGVAHLLNRVRIGEQPDCDTAVTLAVAQYMSDVGDAGFTGKDLDNDRQQRFTYAEQKALTEALVRAWYLRELPRIQERYRVLAVEREIEPILLADEIYLQSRVDAELQDLQTEEYVNYSLKTAKMWDERMEESYKSDLQGITEIWAAERDSERAYEYYLDIHNRCGDLSNLQKPGIKNLATIRDWSYKQAESAKRKISAIRFCYLIKGKQYKHEGIVDALTTTYNPLIRGYRCITPGGIEYAHSWSYPNPENKSGRSTLGKGWEPFNVWESSIGLKNWIDWLNTGAVQPECGDIVKQHVVTPPEYFRNEEEIKTGMAECRYQEIRVFNAALVVNNETLPIAIREAELERTFPHNRKRCFFRFGDRCEYYDLCWRPEIAADPIGSELYQIRTPHHEKEKAYLAA